MGSEELRYLLGGPHEAGEEVVYLLRAHDVDEFRTPGRGRSKCKIGTTSDLGTRLPKVYNGSSDPLELMATYPGGTDLERALHAWFDSLRKHLEWFYFFDVEPKPLVDRAVEVIRKQRLEWKSNEQRKKEIAQAARSTRKAEQHLRLLGSEIRRIQDLGQRVHAEAVRVLAWDFTPRTEEDGALADRVSLEHVYLLDLLPDHLGRLLDDMKRSITSAVRAGVLSTADARTSSGLDDRTVEQIMHKPQAPSTGPWELIARWRAPLNSTDPLGA
ncbi:GIY-YIG nuclease family protein [Streptomyces sp. NPDC012769]|uniref:GIY-YIG nuclease family protein n=1 Tax=Streptomyces sp. NPDC012769 TaxID=3364848 RepID=UPI0036C36235